VYVITEIPHGAPGAPMGPLLAYPAWLPPPPPVPGAFVAPVPLHGMAYAWSFPDRDSAIYWGGELRTAFPGQLFWMFVMGLNPVESI